MITKQTKFILAITLQVVIVFTLIIFKVTVLSGGTSVLLQASPVDPNDLLRGDYITLQYNGVSYIDSYIYGMQQIRNGSTVYVLLYDNGRDWTVQGIQKTKPSNKTVVSGEVYLKGKVVSGGVEDQQFGKPSLHIVYGIEDYFIPEGKGQSLDFWNMMAGTSVTVDKNGDSVVNLPENIVQGFSPKHKNVVARVIVGKNGNAILKQIYVDEKPWP